jgi:hypothetical protein
MGVVTCFSETQTQTAQVGMGMVMAMQRSAAWSDGVLKVVDVLGEGASGAVEAVEDARNGRRYSTRAR